MLSRINCFLSPSLWRLAFDWFKFLSVLSWLLITLAVESGHHKTKQALHLIRVFMSHPTIWLSCVQKPLNFIMRTLFSRRPQPDQTQTKIQWKLLNSSKMLWKWNNEHLRQLNPVWLLFCCPLWTVYWKTLN